MFHKQVLKVKRANNDRILIFGWTIDTNWKWSCVGTATCSPQLLKHTCRNKHVCFHSAGEQSLSAMWPTHPHEHATMLRYQLNMVLHRYSFMFSSTPPFSSFLLPPYFNLCFFLLFPYITHLHCVCVCARVFMFGWISSGLGPASISDVLFPLNAVDGKSSDLQSWVLTSQAFYCPF